MNAFVLASLLTLATSLPSFAQTEDLNARDPRLKEGQLFVVKLIPFGKRMEVLITGKEAARIESSQLGLKATVFVGDKAISLTPKKSAELEKPQFSLEPLDPKASRLKLEVIEGKKKEQFNFEPLH